VRAVPRRLAAGLIGYARQAVAIRRRVRLERLLDDAEIVRTAHAPITLPRPEQVRHEDADQEDQDRQQHEQLDEAEASPSAATRTITINTRHRRECNRGHF